jgi:hypothetical protein
MKIVTTKITTERKNFPIIAGMPFNNPKDMKLKKVGIRTTEFTYHVNVYENGYEDKMLIGQKEVKRKLYN